MNLLSNTKLLIISFLLFYTYDSTCQVNVSWSDLALQNDSPITSNDMVVVEPDDRLVISTSCDAETLLNAKGILVYGELVVENSSFDQNCLGSNLRTDWILVAQNGGFTIGTSTSDYDGNFELIITGAENDVFSLDPVINQTANYISTSSVSQSSTSSRMPEPIQVETMVGINNYSFLMAMGSNAEISLHSTSGNAKTSWVQLNQTASIGSNTIVVDKNPNWEVGDKIVIATTDFDLDQSEEFTITAVSSNGLNITLDGPMTFMHYGQIETYSNGSRDWQLDMRAEVGLLSRNLKIRGDTDFDPSIDLNMQANKFGGHVMVMMGGKGFIQGVEFENMGQGGLVGRYPFHWHMLVDASGQYMKNSSIHHTFNKGLTIHGTHNTLVQDNVIFETIGHSYFLEDGSEIGNELIQNLSVNTRKPINKAAEPDDSDDFANASNYWIENANNTLTDNHAAGSEGNGFFFSLRGVNGLSNRAPFASILKPFESREGPTDFNGNVSHSVVDRAFFLNHAGYVRDESYIGTAAQPQVVNEFWTVNNFTAYKSDLSIYVRGIGGIFNESITAEIGSGTRFRLNQTLNNSLVVGRSGNIGHPVSVAEVNEGRSLPDAEQFTGHQLYDGPGGLSNVHFHGFSGSSDAAIRESNAVHKAATHYAHQVSFDNGTPHSNKLKLGTTPIESRAIIDIDGSLTGIEGAKIVGTSNGGSELYYSANSFIEMDWNAIVHPAEVTVGSLKMRGEFHNDVPAAEAPIVNGTPVPNGNNQITSLLAISKTNGASVGNLDLNNTVRDQSLFLIDDGFDFKLTFTNAPSNFQMYINDLPLDKEIIYEIEGLDPILSRFYMDDNLNTPYKELASLSELESSSSSGIFRNSETGSIHIKFTAELRHGWLFPQPHMTYLGSLLGGNKVNVVLCKQSMVLTETDGPLNGFYEASEEIIIDGNLNILSDQSITFVAPEVTINGAVNASLGANLGVQPDGCQ